MINIMDTLCSVTDNQLHIYPSVYELIHNDNIDVKNSMVINEILDTLDNLLLTSPVIEFHVHTGKMGISQISKYKSVSNLFIQIVSVKYQTSMLDKCYFYDVNRTMKALLEMLKPVLPSVVKERIVIVKETEDDKEQ